MSMRKGKIFVADFETTVYDGQTATEVWAAGCAELFSDDVQIFSSIEEQFDYFIQQDCNIVCYYHNLKFDGSFWLYYLLVVKGFKHAADFEDDNIVESFTWQKKKEMHNNTFTYSISDMGQWYRMLIKVKNHYIELRDSLKLLPFSVKDIGNSFDTPHKKLEMEYKGFRYAGCEITEEEREYLKNDVLVMKEALEIMYTEGHVKLTIGSCCLSEYKESVGGKLYNKLFPNLYGIPLTDEYGAESVGAYVRKAYHGGWCYLVKGKEKKIFTNGTTADVNSLYPSMMSSESGNEYPTGLPTFWRGNFIPEVAEQNYFFVRFKTRFYIKDGKLPFIQIKNSLAYKMTEMLETSDRFNKADGKYYSEYYDMNGELQKATLTLTMTMTDYKLFKEHYNVKDFEILDGCYFTPVVGLFDKYIEKYKKQKLENKGAKRTLAKLYLNNLYGKMASNTNSSFKVAYVKENNTIGFFTVPANDKQPGYIAVGAAITSYARNFTIRAAQKNYHGVNESGFIYADTDSIHCDLKPEEIKGIKVHNKNFCCWDLESCWDIGYFVRQKTYIEHVTHEELEEVDPYFSVKCAGMPQKCKDLFIESMKDKPDLTDRTEDEKEFLQQHRTISDFNIGLTVPGKLIPKRVPGGTLLVDTTYEMR